MKAKKSKSKFAEQSSNRLEIEERITYDMKNSSNYVDWICSYTGKVGGFTTNYSDWSSPDSLSEVDIRNIKNLPLFYNVINDYAYELGEIPLNNDFGCHYLFKYNDIPFEIGVLAAGDVVFYIERLPYIPKECINYNDLLECNKKMIRTRK